MVSRPRRDGRTVGRPTKYNAERAESIVRSIQAGATKKAAAAAAGLGHRTLYDYLQIGQEALEDAEDDMDRVDPDRLSYAQFARAVEVAEGQVRENVASTFLIAALSGADWRAAQAWLKAREPEEWNPPEKIQHDAGDTLMQLLATGLVIEDDEEETESEDESIEHSPEDQEGNAWSQDDDQ